MKTLWGVATFLGCVWVVSLLYGEMVAFWVPVWTCEWPTLNTSSNVREGSRNEPVKVAVIADPQLTDRTTHGMAPGSFALKATQFYSDIYMRRSFGKSVLAFKPDEIIFLGDYFDGGPYLSKEEYQESLKRFVHIFDQSEGSGKSRSSIIPVHFLSGNHDLGYAGLQAERPEIVERYKQVFGETEHVDRIGAVDFIFVDAQALDGSMANFRTIDTWRFVQNLSSEINSPHRVLLSHIPLYRPDDTPCGTDRSSPVINQRISFGRSRSQGIVYQNYLTEATTVKLLDLLKPVLVLSGHDHDQCTVKHRTHSVSVTEHTVGSFSWQNGNLYPSFLLLSVVSASSSEQTSQDQFVSAELCLLPYQTYIYIWYGALFVMSLVLLLFWPSQGVDWPQILYKIWQFMVKLGSIDGGIKAKDEDTNCEYEMVWDSEGAMHLIRKGFIRTDNGRSDESQVSGRSTALAQPAVKRQVLDTSYPSNPNSSNIQSSKSEANESVVWPVRSRTNFFRRRLKQVLGPLVALVAFNVGLYVMLVMKDWTKI